MTRFALLIVVPDVVAVASFSLLLLFGIAACRFFSLECHFVLVLSNMSTCGRVFFEFFVCALVHGVVGCLTYNHTGDVVQCVVTLSREHEC